jgi:hypothetical protein
MTENDMVDVELELPDDLLFELMKLAHEKDITLNQLVNDIIREELSKENPFTSITTGD